MFNALSVDVEEWFCVSNYADAIPRDQWPFQESRIQQQIDILLELFARRRVIATFFLLGWVAEQHPQMVRAIASGGHEIATHGYGHELVYRMDPSRFEEDISKSLSLIRDIAGITCRGYRAPSFSLRRDMSWAWSILVKNGIQYSSSVFPILHDRYGEPDAPRVPFQMNTPNGILWEIPLSTLRVLGRNWPIAGGGYLRLYPYALTRWAIQKLNQEHLPAIVYFHPWEIDPQQPSPRGVSLWRLWRHRTGLESFASKLEKLLCDFDFGPMSKLIPAVH